MTGFRYFFKETGRTQRWWDEMQTLTEDEKAELYTIIFNNDFNDVDSLTDNRKYRHILTTYYKNFRNEIIDPKSDLYKEKQEWEAKRVKNYG